MTDPNTLDLDRVQRVRRMAAEKQIFKLLVAYVVVVLLNALSVMVIFWLRVFGQVDISYGALSAWAVGSGGLGAGALIFLIPLRALFSIDTSN